MDELTGLPFEEILGAIGRELDNRIISIRQEIDAVRDVAHAANATTRSPLPSEPAPLAFIKSALDLEQIIRHVANEATGARLDSLEARIPPMPPDPPSPPPIPAAIVEMEVRLTAALAEVRELRERLDAAEHRQSTWRRGIDAVLGRKPR